MLLKDDLDPAHVALTRYKADVADAGAGQKPARPPVLACCRETFSRRWRWICLLDDSMKLVSLIGAAGTGKTLVALAAGMAKVLNEQVYTKLLCAAPSCPWAATSAICPATRTKS